MCDTLTPEERAGAGRILTGFWNSARRLDQSFDGRMDWRSRLSAELCVYYGQCMRELRPYVWRGRIRRGGGRRG